MVGIVGALWMAEGIQVCFCAVKGMTMLWVWAYSLSGHRGRALRLCRGQCAVLRVAA